MLFGRDDSPPWKLSAFLGAQHLLVALLYLIYPVLLVQESGHSTEESRLMLVATLAVTGLTTLLQARAGRRLGSGFLAVQVANPIFLPLSLAAVQMGGLGLLASLLAVTGFAQVLFARVFHRLRTIFPAEVCGVVILMLGVSMVNMAIQRCTGASLDGHIVPRHLAISGLTLGVIIGLTIWVRSSLRLFAVGIGIAAGYAASWILGLLTSETFTALEHHPVMAFPALALPAFRWNPTLLLPFLLTGIISSLDTAGGLILCQKMHDRHWVRPDLHNLGRGMLTDGLGNMAAGLLGSFGIGVGSSNIGLAMANFFLLTALAVTVFGVPLKGSFGTLTLTALVYVACATGFGLLASTFTHSQIAAMFVTIIGTLIPTVQYAGLLNPVSSLEGVGAFIGQIFPATYFLTVSRGVFSKALDLPGLWPSFWPLLVMAPAILGLAIVLLKKQES